MFLVYNKLVRASNKFIIQSIKEVYIDINDINKISIFAVMRFNEAWTTSMVYRLLAIKDIKASFV